MSGPAAPYSTGVAILSPVELLKFEAPLIALANLSGGDPRKLFHAFFAFLHTRTYFYCVVDGDGGGGRMGFKEGQAERILLASFRQFPLRKVAPPPTPASGDGAVRSSAIASKKGESKSAVAAISEIAALKGDLSATKSAAVSSSPRRTLSEDSLAETTATMDTMGTSTSVNSNADTVGEVVLPQSGTKKSSSKSSSPQSLLSKSKWTVRYTNEGKQVHW